METALVAFAWRDGLAKMTTGVLEAMKRDRLSPEQARGLLRRETQKFVQRFDLAGRLCRKENYTKCDCVEMEKRARQLVDELKTQRGGS